MAEHIVTLVVSTDETSDPREWDWEGRLGAREARVLSASVLPQRLALPPLSPLLRGSALDDEAPTSDGLAPAESSGAEDEWSQALAPEESDTGASEDWMAAGSGWDAVSSAEDPAVAEEPSSDTSELSVMFADDTDAGEPLTFEAEEDATHSETPTALAPESDETEEAGSDEVFSNEAFGFSADETTDAPALALESEVSPADEDSDVDPALLAEYETSWQSPEAETEGLGESEDALAVAYEFPESDPDAFEADSSPSPAGESEESWLTAGGGEDEDASGPEEVEVPPADAGPAEDLTAADAGGPEDTGEEDTGWSGFGQEMAALAATPEPEVAEAPSEEMLTPDERKTRAYQLFEQLWIEVCQKADASHMVLLSQFTELTPAQMLKRLSGTLDAAGNVPAPIDPAHARAVAEEIRRLDPDNYGTG